MLENISDAIDFKTRQANTQFVIIEPESSAVRDAKVTQHKSSWTEFSLWTFHFMVCGLTHWRSVLTREIYVFQGKSDFL